MVDCSQFYLKDSLKLKTSGIQSQRDTGFKRKKYEKEPS